MVKNKLKETEIGMIPEEWKVEKLKELCIKITDGSHFSPKTKPEGKLIATVKDMNEYGFDYETCRRISEQDFNQLAKQDCKPKINDVLIAKDGSYLKHVFVTTKDEEIVILSSIAIIRPNVEKITPYFLKYLFSDPITRERVKGNYVSGAVIPRIVLKDFAKIDLPVPSLQEQTTIAKILSDLDTKIELNQQMNKTLEAIGQALFKRWFVDFEFPNEKGKPYKSSGGEMVESELGEIPRGWNVSKLEDYGTFKNGINYLRDETGDTDFFIANVRDIANNKLLLKNSLDNISLNMKKAQDYLLKDKDILIARSASPGEVSLVLGNLDKVIYSGFSIRYRLNNPNNYLYIFLIMQRLKENLSNFAVGTTLQSVNQDTLKNMKFILPTDKTLNDFNKIIEKILGRTYNNLIQNGNLLQIRDSLLPRLMSGKIRVPVGVR